MDCFLYGGDVCFKRINKTYLSQNRGVGGSLYFWVFCTILFHKTVPNLGKNFKHNWWHTFQCPKWQKRLKLNQNVKVKNK